jgi:hypothetical protein
MKTILMILEIWIAASFIVGLCASRLMGVGGDEDVREYENDVKRLNQGHYYPLRGSCSPSEVSRRAILN